MSDSSDFRHLGASEFPNDNPLLHDGAVWVCFSPCGPLRPVVRPRTGARGSTIPAPLAVPIVSAAPPARKSELIIPPPIEARPAVELPVAVEAAATLPLPPLELEFTPNAVAETSVEEPLDLEPIASVVSSGCSLSAGLAPADESPSAEPRVSELRERFHAEGADDVANDEEEAGAPPSLETHQDLSPGFDEPAPVNVAPIALPPVDVECAPSDPSEETSVATVAGEAERMTILPPPSEDGARTLTLTRIRVSGRSIEVTSEAAPPMDVPTAEPAVAAEASGEPRVADAAPREQDPFAAFVAALVEVALSGGATRAAAVLPGLLDGKALALSGFTDAVLSSIVSASIVSGDAGNHAPTASFTATSNAWRMVLRGESNDFSACGTSTLDGWAADVLKAFGVGRDGRVDVRRELRRRGVAAFGMILAA